LQEELEGFVGKTMLRVIQVDTYRRGGQALAAGGISREELPQMQLSDVLIVDSESLPGSACRE
jgi:hypothetical protein